MHAETRRFAVAMAFTATLAVQTTGQSARTLTLEAIYDPSARADFNGTPSPDVAWLDGRTYVVPRAGGRGVEWLKVDAATGRSSPLFDAERMEAAIGGLPGVTREEARLLARTPDIIFNPAKTAAVIELSDDLYFYDFVTQAITRLTTAPGSELEAAFSPDGRRVAYVRGHNLYAVDIASRQETAFTRDGGPQILNGRLDWLYQEEIYGRGRFRAFWWSPDSTRLAFLRLDEKPVPEYTVVDYLPYRNILEVTDYPKAGDPNPIVAVGIADIESGQTRWVNLDGYKAADPLVVNVGWTADSRHVVHQVQNREQTWLDLNLADAATGTPRTLFRETTPAWVNENGNPVWLRDGSFLWMSESTGFKHLYRISSDGRERRPVTSGRWDIRTLHGVDHDGSAIYFSAGARDHLSTDIYRIGIDGQGMTRLSTTDGSHRATFSPSFEYYVDEWSTITTPTQARLHDRTGKEVRVLEANPVRAVREYRLATPEFVQIKARDGFPLDAMMLKPPDFSPSRRYPVYQFTYAGPGTPQVRNQWGGSQYMFHQLLAQRGIIVWVLDNRSAGGRGAEAQWPVHGRLGELELQDLEDGAAWLKRQPYVDGSRLVLSGWSYGGFMTAYAMTHSATWSAGIVGGAVTDWRDYDTIYTERYMKLPSNNADGYQRTAPRFAAGKVQGRMLLLHGMMDDNVHVQNAVQLAYELQRAGKPFEMMLYPRSRHGISDPRLNLHMRKLMYDFILRETRPETPR